MMMMLLVVVVMVMPHAMMFPDVDDNEKIHDDHVDDNGDDDCSKDFRRASASLRRCHHVCGCFGSVGVVVVVVVRRCC